MDIKWSKRVTSKIGDFERLWLMRFGISKGEDKPKDLNVWTKDIWPGWLEHLGFEENSLLTC